MAEAPAEKLNIPFPKDLEDIRKSWEVLDTWSQIALVYRSQCVLKAYNELKACQDSDPKNCGELVRKFVEESSQKTSPCVNHLYQNTPSRCKAEIEEFYVSLQKNNNLFANVPEQYAKFTTCLQKI